jgi:hypothetical protein
VTRFSDLPEEQQRAIVAVGVISTLWQLWMLWDLWRRPNERVNGQKRWWVLASFVRPFGQIAYLLRGRRPPAEGWPDAGDVVAAEVFADVGPDELAG